LATSTDYNVLVYSEPPDDEYHPLSFWDGENNISHVGMGDSNRYVAFKDARWNGQLLPHAYSSQSSGPDPETGGLSGDLALIVSLIGFSCRDRTSLHRVLTHDRSWRNYEWFPHQHRSGRECCHIQPIEAWLLTDSCFLDAPERGLVSTIFLDPDNALSTPEALEELENGGMPLFVP
jgi:hypothetical protein